MAEKFINPYNFISFPAKKASAYTDTDKHTGVIEYSITTKTPLFIPNSSSETAFTESDKIADHKSYDFFSYTELDSGKKYEGEYHVPVIPGSEMRGVVRNVYETLTDSCMGLLNSEVRPMKRMMANFLPGLLHKNSKGRFELYEADSFKKSFAECSNLRNGYQIAKGGYWLKWGKGGTKKNYHVYHLKNGAKIKYTFEGVSEQKSRKTVEEKLFPVIDAYLSGGTVENKKAYKEYKADLISFLDGKMAYFPVNYAEISTDLFYLSPAAITKEYYTNSIGLLAGQFAPCKTTLCPACKLFGNVGSTEKSGSQIRFTDLYVSEQRNPRDYYLCSKVTIPPLGSPKLGNTEFYLKQPKGASFWTYDYYSKYGKIIVEKGNLRGRKFYWHHKNIKFEKMGVTNLNKTIRPVKEQVTFCGRLYFEGISHRQLNQLIWILNSGSEGIGLKLGAAKPLGLGSITCKVERVQERKITVDNGVMEYVAAPLKEVKLTYEQVGFSNSIVKDEFYKIASLKNYVEKENLQITYPKLIVGGQKKTEGYEWFVNNRNLRPRDSAKIYYSLPMITSEELGMPYNPKFSKTGQGSNNKGDSHKNNWSTKRDGRVKKNGGSNQKGRY